LEWLEVQFFFGISRTVTDQDSIKTLKKNREGMSYVSRWVQHYVACANWTEKQGQ